MNFIARFFLLVMVLSVGEFYVLMLAAEHTNVFFTLSMCILTGVLGGAMVRKQGLSTLESIKSSMGQGQIPGIDIVSGLILIVIGTLMLTPGFITDTVAFILLIPMIRKLAAANLLKYFKKNMKTFARNSSTKAFYSGFSTQDYRRPDDENVIEVDAQIIDPK